MPGGECVVQAELRGAHVQGRQRAHRGVRPGPGVWVAAGGPGMSVVHGPQCQRRARGGVCRPAGGRLPH